MRDLMQEVLRFRDERDWAQFHTPRQLAAALAIEAAELQEILLWKTDEQAAELMRDDAGAEGVRHEVADILIYALLMAASGGFDPVSAIREKLALNAEKYPVSESKGRATKYTELPSADRSKPE